MKDEKYDYQLKHPQGLDRPLITKKDLVNFVTKIIFQASAGHAAVNFMQFEYMCFAPNVPAVMRGKIPKEDDRGKIGMERILSSLPSMRSSLIQAGAAYALSEFSDVEVFLLPTGAKGSEPSKPPRWLFTKGEVDKAYFNFLIKLSEIEEKIINRREEGKVPYEVLLPSRIPYGIAI